MQHSPSPELPRTARTAPRLLTCVEQRYQAGQDRVLFLQTRLKESVTTRKVAFSLSRNAMARSLMSTPATCSLPSGRSEPARRRYKPDSEVCGPARSLSMEVCRHPAIEETEKRTTAQFKEIPFHRSEGASPSCRPRKSQYCV